MKSVYDATTTKFRRKITESLIEFGGDERAHLRFSRLAFYDNQARKAMQMDPALQDHENFQELFQELQDEIQECQSVLVMMG